MLMKLSVTLSKVTQQEPKFRPEAMLRIELVREVLQEAPIQSEITNCEDNCESAADHSKLCNDVRDNRAYCNFPCQFLNFKKCKIDCGSRNFARGKKVTERGARTLDHQVKSLTLYRLS